MMTTMTYVAQHGTWPAKDLLARVSANNVKSRGKSRIHLNKLYYREDTGIVGYRLWSDALLIVLYGQVIKTTTIMIIIIIVILTFDLETNDRSSSSGSIGALGSVSKKLAGHLELLGITDRKRTMQKSALLGSEHILRKVLEVWGFGMRLDWISLPRKKTLCVILQNNTNIINILKTDSH